MLAYSYTISNCDTLVNYQLSSSAQSYQLDANEGILQLIQNPTISHSRHPFSAIMPHSSLATPTSLDTEYAHECAPWLVIRKHMGNRCMYSIATLPSLITRAITQGPSIGSTVQHHQQLYTYIHEATTLYVSVHLSTDKLC